MRLLCLVHEVGAAAYLLPLWRRYLAAGGPDWVLSATDAVRRFLTRSQLPLEAVVDLLEPAAVSAWIARERPSMVLLSATHHPCERAAIEACRTSGIPTVGLIDTWVNYRYRFDWQADGLCLPDHLLMPDQTAIDEAVAEGLPLEVCTAIGQPAWECVQPLPLPAGRRTMFVCQPLAERYERRLGYTEADAWALVREAAQQFPDLLGPLHYALHPVGATPEGDQLGDARLVSDGARALADVDVVLGMSSSLMVDALLAGRRVVSVQPGMLGDNLDPLSRQGHIARVESVDALQAALQVAPSASDGLAGMLAGSLDRLEQFLSERMKRE